MISAGKGSVPSPCTGSTFSSHASKSVASANVGHSQAPRSRQRSLVHVMRRG